MGGRESLPLICALRGMLVVLCPSPEMSTNTSVARRRGRCLSWLLMTGPVTGLSANASSFVTLSFDPPSAIRHVLPLRRQLIHFWLRVSRLRDTPRGEVSQQHREIRSWPSSRIVYHSLV